MFLGGCPQLCKLPFIYMQQNASGQSNKINAKVKFQLQTPFSRIVFCGVHGNQTKNINNLRMRVYAKNQSP